MLGDSIGNRGRQRCFFMPGQLTLAALRALGSAASILLSNLTCSLPSLQRFTPSLEAAVSVVWTTYSFSYQELPKTRKEKPK